MYILDQVRALEREMLRRIEMAGLDLKPQILVVTRLIPEAQGTTCDQRIEAINGTHYARILRVPFRDKGGKVIPHWMSRYSPTSQHCDPACKYCELSSAVSISSKLCCL